MKVGNYILQLLVKHGIKRIYGYPGGTILPFIQAIKSCDEIEWILMRSEQSAAFAASAEAKLTHKVTCCISTSGPGAINLLTGLVDADTDQVPVLAITGLTSIERQEQDVFQDFSHKNLFSNILPYSVECKNYNNVPNLFYAAICFAIKTRRVAHISLPVNMFEDDISLNEFPISQWQANYFNFVQAPQSAIDKFCEKISVFKHPVIAVGALISEQCNAIESFAKHFSLPILTSYGGKGLVREDHPCYAGTIGVYGGNTQLLAQKILNRSDLVICLGVETINVFVTNNKGKQVRQFALCGQDLTLQNFQYHSAAVLLSNISDALMMIEQTLNPPHTWVENLKHLSARNSINKNTCIQATFMTKLSEKLNENHIIALDTGDHAIWAINELFLTKHQRVILSNRFGAMGFAIPAAIACSLTEPDKKIICICGDGGAQFSLAELKNADTLQNNIIFVIYNNQALGRIVSEQNSTFGALLDNPDFHAIATACGLQGYTISDPNDIDKVLNQALNDTKSCLINLMCDKDVFAPFFR